MRPVIRALVLAAALVATAAPAASARPRARAADPGAGRGIGFPVRDRVVHGSASRARAAALQGYGGVRRAGTGTILITMSGYYTPDESVLQSWADFFGGLIHGSELNRLRVYLASPAEITDLCGADSDACYYDDRATLYMPGDAVSGGNSTEAVVAHEYGHHVATFRDNSPWRAVDFGPKYWATYEDVCRRTRAHRLFPGDEDAHYELNPGEGWAEVYRSLNGYGWEGIVTSALKPGKDALYWARQDVIHPYQPNYYDPWKGRFRRRGARSKYRTLTIDNDGTVDIRVRAQRGLDTDVYLYAGRKLVKSARLDGRSERLRYRSCGHGKLRLEVYRYRGYGTFSVRDFLPFDADGV